MAVETAPAEGRQGAPGSSPRREWLDPGPEAQSHVGVSEGAEPEEEDSEEDAVTRRATVTLKGQVQHILKRPPHRRTLGELGRLASVFGKLNFFKELDATVRQQVCRHLKLETVPANTHIFREGEPGEKFYVIVSGSVGVFIKDLSAEVEDDASAEKAKADKDRHAEEAAQPLFQSTIKFANMTSSFSWGFGSGAFGRDAAGSPSAVPMSAMTPKASLGVERQVLSPRAKQLLSTAGSLWQQEAMLAKRTADLMGKSPAEVLDPHHGVGGVLTAGAQAAAGEGSEGSLPHTAPAALFRAAALVGRAGAASPMVAGSLSATPTRQRVVLRATKMPDAMVNAQACLKDLEVFDQDGGEWLRQASSRRESKLQNGGSAGGSKAGAKAGRTGEEWQSSEGSSGESDSDSASRGPRGGSSSSSLHGPGSAKGNDDAARAEDMPEGAQWPSEGGPKGFHSGHRDVQIVAPDEQEAHLRKILTSRLRLDENDPENEEGTAVQRSRYSSVYSSQASGGWSRQVSGASRRGHLGKTVSIVEDEELGSRLGSRKMADDFWPSECDSYPTWSRQVSRDTAGSGGEREGRRRRLTSRRSHIHHVKLTEVAVLKQGDSFGEVALQNDLPRSATIKTKEACVLATLTRDDYKAVLQSTFDAIQQERLNFIRSVPMLTGVPEAAITKLSMMMQVRVYIRHEVVVDVGTPMLQVYFVRDGAFAVERRMRGPTAEASREEDAGSLASPRDTSTTPLGAPSPGATSAGGMAATMSTIGGGSLVNTGANAAASLAAALTAGRAPAEEVRERERSVVAATYTPPATFGLTGYLRADKICQHRIVCASCHASAYALLAKELLHHLPREQRNYLQAVSRVQEAFYENRFLVLSSLNEAERAEAIEMLRSGGGETGAAAFTPGAAVPGARSWPRSRRRKRGGATQGAGSVYSLEGRLQKIGGVFLGSQEDVGKGSCEVAQKADPQRNAQGHGHQGDHQAHHQAQHRAAEAAQHKPPLDLKPVWHMEGVAKGAAPQQPVHHNTLRCQSPATLAVKKSVAEASAASRAADLAEVELMESVAGEASATWSRSLRQPSSNSGALTSDTMSLPTKFSKEIMHSAGFGLPTSSQRSGHAARQAALAHNTAYSAAGAALAAEKAANEASPRPAGAEVDREESSPPCEPQASVASTASPSPRGAASPRRRRPASRGISGASSQLSSLRPAKERGPASPAESSDVAQAVEAAPLLPPLRPGTAGPCSSAPGDADGDASGRPRPRTSCHTAPAAATAGRAAQASAAAEAQRPHTADRAFALPSMPPEALDFFSEHVLASTTTSEPDASTRRRSADTGPSRSGRSSAQGRQSPAVLPAGAPAAARTPGVVETCSVWVPPEPKGGSRPPRRRFKGMSKCLLMASVEEGESRLLSCRSVQL